MKANESIQIKQAVEKLKAFGAKEVYLFGSIIEKTYTESSDIDMAVSGIPPQSFFRALSEASLKSNRTIDLIDLDEETSFTHYLKTTGKLQRVG